ncbi:MAG: dihydroorotase [Flavobacteriales bacterium]
MHLILKNAQIIDPEGKYHQQQADILIQNGVIQKIGKVEAGADDKQVDTTACVVMPGAIDINTFAGEPGYEEKETLETLRAAAQQGGFSELCTRSDLLPAVDHSGQASYLKKQSTGSAVELLPIGSISKGLKGESLSEMYDMHLAGAVAFGDAKKAITNLQLISLAMQYVKSFGGKLIFFADEPTLTKGGQMHEGEVSIHLGMKGVPAIAEEMAVRRILELAEYNQSEVILFGISTKEAIEAIRIAKEKRLKVKAGTFVHHLYFTDEALRSFDSNFKLHPPLRSDQHRNALINGIKSGVIDFLSADHCPENIEHKQVEFDYAAHGMIGLESALSASWTVLRKHIGMEQFVKLWSFNSRSMLGLPASHIEEGAPAKITLFAPDQVYEFGRQHRKSLSNNSAYYGQKFTGKVMGTIGGGEWHLAS